MTMIRCATACFCVMAFAVTSGAQSGSGPAGGQSFAFRPGQRVYIAAYQTFDHFTLHQLNAFPPRKDY